MPMVILPSNPRYAWLMSFWLAISVWCGLLFGVLLALLGSPRWFGLGGILVLLLAIPGLMRPQVVSLPYRAWNKLARAYARAARLLLMGICFYVLVVAVSRTGSSLRLARPTSAKSLWVPRGTLAPIAYAHQYSGTVKESPQQGWIRTYLSWAAQSGNLWAVCLLPFLFMLMILEPDHENSFYANIYTLF